MRYFAFLFALFVFVACNNTSESQTKIVTAEEVQSLMHKDGVQLIDVRTPEEYKDGFITNAINIDYFSPSFSEDIKVLDKEKPVIVYCRSGNRSAKSAKILEEAGFKEIYDLEGGFTNWKDLGLDFETE